MTLLAEHEIVISRHDAQALGVMLGAIDDDAADALQTALAAARIVAPERLPRGAVALNRAVTYAQHPGGDPRTVTVVLPHEADVRAGRISVLSPIGRALLGRAAGDRVTARLPAGHEILLHVHAVDGEAEP